jgi:hypothetical protein
VAEHLRREHNALVQKLALRLFVPCDGHLTRGRDGLGLDLVLLASKLHGAGTELSGVRQALAVGERGAGSALAARVGVAHLEGTAGVVCIAGQLVASLDAVRYSLTQLAEEQRKIKTEFGQKMTV